MSLKVGFAIFAFGLLIVAGAFFLPMMTAQVGEDVTRSVSLQEGEQHVADGTLELSIENVTGAQANGTILDRGSGDAANFSLDEGENSTVQLGGESVDVEATYVSEPGGTFAITSAARFGWDDGLDPIVDNLDIMIGILMLMIVFGGLFIGVRML